MPNADDRKTGEPDDSRTFRRRKKPEAEVAEILPPERDAGEPATRLDPGQLARLIVDSRSGMVDREAASSIARPLTELARAFALQAEVLKQVHEGQAAIGKAVADDEKNKLVVNSTRALNDTFRGLRETQQKLLEELDERDRGSRRGVWLWAGVAVVAVVATWLVFDHIDRGRVQDRARLDSSLDELRGAVGDDYRDRIAQAERRAAELESRLGERQQHAEGLGTRIAELLREQSEQKTRIERAEADLQAARSRADEADRRAGESAARAASFLVQRDELNEKLETSRKEVERLRDQVLAKIRTPGAEWDFPETPTGARVEEPRVKEAERVAVPETSKSQPAEPEKEKEAEVPESVVRGTQAPIIDRLNELLALHRRSESYAIESIRKIGVDRLEGVVVTESLPGKGLMRRISAEELVFSVDRRGDLVELEFSKGDVRSRNDLGALGAAVPFYNDRFRLTIEPSDKQAWPGEKRGFIRLR